MLCRRVLKYLFQQAPHNVYLSDPRRLKISLVWWSLIALLVVRPTKTQLKLCRYQSLNPDNLVYWSLIFTLCAWLDITNNSLYIYLHNLWCKSSRNILFTARSFSLALSIAIYLEFSWWSCSVFSYWSLLSYCFGSVISDN